MFSISNEMRSSIAINLESLTSQYFILDEQLFKFSWKRIIPIPGFFDAIDYKSLLISGKAIDSEINSVRARILSLQKEKDARQGANDFISAALKFCDDFQLAIVALNKILENLQNKVSDPKSYSKSQYDKDCGFYEQLKKEAGNSYDSMALVYQNTKKHG